MGEPKEINENNPQLWKQNNSFFISYFLFLRHNFSRGKLCWIVSVFDQLPDDLFCMVKYQPQLKRMYYILLILTGPNVELAWQCIAHWNGQEKKYERPERRNWSNMQIIVRWGCQSYENSELSKGAFCVFKGKLLYNLTIIQIMIA